MRDFNGYVKVSHGPISEAKLRKAAKSGKLNFTKEELKGSGCTTLFHPENAKKLKASKAKGKGSNINITGGEIKADMKFHRTGGSGLEGGSIWSWIKDKAWPWLKKNVLPVAADVGAEALGAYTGRPDLAATGRAVLKKVTGIGMDGGAVKPMTTHEKRVAAAAKARAAKAAKKTKPSGDGLYV